MNIEKTTKTFFIVEIGGADLYFEKLEEASNFFGKLVGANAHKVGRLGYGDNSYHFQDGKHFPSMKQETIDIYPTRKAAEFAKSSNGDE